MCLSIRTPDHGSNWPANYHSFHRETRFLICSHDLTRLSAEISARFLKTFARNLICVTRQPLFIQSAFYFGGKISEIFPNVETASANLFDFNGMHLLRRMVFFHIETHQKFAYVNNEWPQTEWTIHNTYTGKGFTQNRFLRLLSKNLRLVNAANHVCNVTKVNMKMLCLL